MAKVFVGGCGDVFIGALVIPMRDIVVRIEDFLDALKFWKLTNYLKSRNYELSEYYMGWYKQFEDLAELEMELESLLAFLDENDISCELRHDLLESLGEKYV